MSQVAFGGAVPCVFVHLPDWSDEAHPMDHHNGDGIFEREVLVPVDGIDFKYTLCNQADQEMFAGKASCTNQTGVYINRRLDADPSSAVLDASCFERCESCQDRTPQPYVNPLERCAGDPGLALPIRIQQRG